MKTVRKKKTRLRFKNKGAAVIAALLAVMVLALICLAIVGIVNLAKKDDYKDVKLELHPDFTLTALSGSMDCTPNTLSYIKNAAVCGTDLIEVDLMFNSKGEPVLTDNFEEINADTTVPLSKALETLKEYPDVSLLIDLHALTNIPRIEELVEEYDMFGKVFYSGVTMENVDFVESKSPNIQYYMDIDPEQYNTEATEFYDYVRDMSANAYAVNVDIKHMSEEWVQMLMDDTRRISVCNVSTEDDFRKALSLCAANIITDKPAEIQAFIIDWLTGAK